MLRLVAGASTALLLLLLAAPAAAEEVTAADGTTSARLTWTPPEDGVVGIRDVRLSVTRDGAPVFDGDPEVGPCAGEGDGTCAVDFRRPLVVDDVDADGAPDVLVTLYTGGAHCCTVSKGLLASGAVVDYEFGNAAWRLADLDGDAVPEFVTADDRLAYAFASYASSGFPLRIVRVRDGALEDVTARFPARVRVDARRWKRLYRRALRSRGGEPHGLIAAWAADQYRLGRRAAARRYLRGQLRNGNLDRGVTLTSGRVFVRKLDRRLLRLGYR